MGDYTKIQQKYYGEYKNKVITRIININKEHNNWNRLCRRYKYFTIEMLADNCDYVTNKMSMIKDKTLVD